MPAARATSSFSTRCCSACRVFVAKAPVTETKTSAEFSAINDEEITFTYCTEFIVAREKKRHPELLRSFLESLGDSLVLVEDDDIIKVHVHTDAPGRALTEALRYGPLQTVKIENMRNQHTLSPARRPPPRLPPLPSREAEAEPEIAPCREGSRLRCRVRRRRHGRSLPLARCRPDRDRRPDDEPPPRTTFSAR